MVIEAIANTHKRNYRRSRSPDPYEVLEQLDAVDMRLLQWLLRYPFQRAEDLALATGNSNATLYRHLNVLHNNGLIERVMPAALGTAKCWVYHLSNLGLHVLSVHERADPADLARRWSTDDRDLLRLLPRVASLITIQECINGLVVHAPEALAHQGRRSEVRWHLVRNYTHCFPYHEKLMRCTVDAALLLRVHSLTENGLSAQEQWYSLFVLLDAEIANDTCLKQRLGRLLCYRESAERWPVYQHFPPVIVLVSTHRRMEHWQWSAREAATALHVAPLTGAIACLPEKQQIASYNPWLFAWKTLETSGPCTLRHLLHPLPIEAIPPDLLNHIATVHVMPEESRRDDGTVTTTTSPTRKRTRMIVGNYIDRAKAVQKGHMGDTHDQREIIALLGLSLGHRHFELLTLLFTHPLLHACEIAALLDREISSIERYLGLLKSQGCIELLASEVGQRWRLSERGLRLIAATQHIRIQSIATVEESDGETYLVQRGVDVLVRHLEHTAGIYGFFASLSQAASQDRLRGRQHRLLWWDTAAASERRYRDHERWHNLRPDAMGEYQAEERQVRFWLEWDRGTMNVRDLTIKFTSYAHYVASREWTRECSMLPVLVCVAPDIAQERRMQRVAQARLTSPPGLMVWTTTRVLLDEQRPLAPIWLHRRSQSSQAALSGNVLRQCLFDVIPAK